MLMTLSTCLKRARRVDSSVQEISGESFISVTAKLPSFPLFAVRRSAKLQNMSRLHTYLISNTLVCVKIVCLLVGTVFFGMQPQDDTQEVQNVKEQ